MMARAKEKPLLWRPEAGNAMIRSPTAMSAVLGNTEAALTTPTQKPTTSQPPGANTPGNSVSPTSSNLQPASTQPSATPLTSNLAWCASSFSEAKCSWKNNGSAPRAATSLAESATKSMPRLSYWPTLVATFNFVPSALELLTNMSPLPKHALETLPRCKGSTGSSCFQVVRTIGSKLFIAASAAAVSTPAERYVNSSCCRASSTAFDEPPLVGLAPSLGLQPGLRTYGRLASDAFAAMSWRNQESEKLMARTPTYARSLASWSVPPTEATVSTRPPHVITRCCESPSMLPLMPLKLLLGALRDLGVDASFMSSDVVPVWKTCVPGTQSALSSPLMAWPRWKVPG
mmetsp:Transcript_33912/g.102453  ORF Transcript_33912/g.102453 Transcript_33912/m.102453 type:complete len:345 (-) Transcript_33912:910-1944(-)